MLNRKRKQKIKKNKQNTRLWSVGFIIGIFFLLFNETGFIKWFKLTNNKQKITETNTKLLNQQIKLKDEINKLEKDEDYLEKIARERFMFVKKGEKVFRVIDKKSIQN